MASMNGDPLIELEYRKWKEAMTTITTHAGKSVSHLHIIMANPLAETIWMQGVNGQSFPTSNQGIFDALADTGVTPEMLEKRIPKVGWEHLGTYLGVELGLDTQGRFQIGPFPGDPQVIEVDASCQHGFVIRDVQGPNRFLCRECDERFLSYPEKDKFKPDPIDVKSAEQIAKEWEVYQTDIAEQLGDQLGLQRSYVWAEGVIMNDTKIYQLPVSDEIVQSINPRHHLPVATAIEFMGEDKRE